MIAREEHNAFWDLYARLCQPMLEAACRRVVATRTDGGMPVEDLVAWVDDRVWRMVESGGEPLLRGCQTPESAASTIASHADLLARWAYLALCRSYWRRSEASRRHTRELSRAQSLAMVSRAGAGDGNNGVHREDLATIIKQIRESTDQRTRARIAASWEDRSESKRIAQVLGVGGDEELIVEDAAAGKIKANTIDQMRRRSRTKVREALASVRKGAVVLVGVAVIAIASSDAVAGEQTGGRGSRSCAPTPVDVGPASTDKACSIGVAAGL